MRLWHALCIVLIVLWCTCGESKKLKNTKKEKLGNGKKGMNAKVKKAVDEMRAKGVDETAEDEKGNSLHKVRGPKKGDEMVVQQYFKGLRVFGGRILDETIKGGKVTLYKDRKDHSKKSEVTVEPQTLQAGEFYEDLVDDFPDVNKGQLNKLAVQTKNTLRKEFKGYKITDVHAEPIVYIDPKKNEGNLAVYASLEASNDEETKKPVVIFDQSGKEIIRWDDMQHAYEKIGTGPGGNERTGQITYGQDRPEFTVNTDGNECTLETPEIRTLHFIQAATNDDYSPFKFPCSEQNTDEANGGFSPLNDVHSSAELTVDLFHSWYQETPFLYLPLTLNAHYGNNFMASYDKGTGKLNFGNGKSGTAHPMTTVDIVAHEVGHAVTEFCSDLIYKEQSGGLSESFADMTAMAVLYNNNLPMEWKVMNQVGVTADKDALFARCLDDPTCDGKSIDQVLDYTDTMDVHHSSGIFNKVFYLISEQYSMYDAYDLMYASNRKAWSPNTDFFDAAAGVLATLENLQAGIVTLGDYPLTYEWINADDIVDIFKQVGIDCAADEYGWYCLAA